ncbi:MAG: hypothetical protein OEL69_03130 [Nitrosopumilus sp.]|nr:hypothetical protein [Nitrosopumilus sp.]
MSKTNTVYVVQQWNISKLTYEESVCARCSKKFDINDIVANSTRKNIVINVQQR